MTKSIDGIARRVTLRELRLLVAVARSGSILKAAHSVGLAQPAVSKSIHDLERTLGVRLFDRTNRGVEPTPHGHIVLRRAAGVFEELRQAVDELEFLADTRGGEVRIGATPSMCAGLLPHVIRDVEGERPAFRYRIAELESRELSQAVGTRSLDAGLGRAPSVGGDDDIAFERLFEDRLFIVAGAEHPLLRRRAIELKEAAEQRWVLPSADTVVSQQLQAAFNRLGAPMPLSTVTAMSMLIRYELLATNRFLAVLYGSVLQFGHTPRWLRVLPIELSAGVSIGFTKLRNRTVAPAADFFLERIRKIGQPMRSLDAQQLQRALRSRRGQGPD